MTSKQTCTRLQIGPSSLYRLIWAGLLNPVKIGRAVRFRADEVDRIAREGVTVALPRTAAEARAAAGREA